VNKVGTDKIKNREKILFIISAYLAGFALTYKVTEAYPFWAYGEVSLDLMIARIYSCLGDYQFDMIAAAVLSGCAMYLVKTKFGEHLKGIILPTILGFITMMGRQITVTGNVLGMFETFPLIFRSFLAAAGFGVIYRYLFALFEAGLEKISLSEKRSAFGDRFFGEHVYRNVLILLLVLWAPVMILNCPGNHNADFIGQLMQAFGDSPWSKHHPIILTAVIGGYFKIFGAVFGSYDPALFTWILLQAFFFASSLALTIKWLKNRNADQPLLAAVLGVYILSPIYSNIATTAIKDVPFAAACIWYCVLTLTFYEDEEAFLKEKKNLLKFCLAAFLVCMCRNNGSIIVFVNGLVMCVYGMYRSTDKKAVVRKALLFILLPLCIYTGLSSGIAAYTKAESDGLKEMLSVPMQQTTLTLIRYEDEMTPEELASIDALFGDHAKMMESYDPYISDPVKQYYDIHASRDVVAGYLKTWFEQFFKHPGTYIESFFISIHGWFDPETDTSVRYELDSDYFSKTGLFEGADEILIFFYRYIDRISFFGMLQSPGLWTWVMILLIRKRKGYLHLYPMQIVTLLVCMAGPCFMKHARYAFPIMFTMPFMAGFEGLLIRKENGDRK